jgi:alkaline phosphatase
MFDIKRYLFCLALLHTLTLFAQQPVRIHSHNDYDQPEPFTNAWRNKAYIIEADVYPDDSLYVSHEKADIKPGKTLVSVYLQPIEALFAKHHGYISDDTAYAPMLMIDIKENNAVVIPQLVKLLELRREVFDRSVNLHAVQVVLSGERGPQQQWNQWPSYILFDGRPYERYDSATLQRVAFISDTYTNYANDNNIAATEKRLKELADKVHALANC